MGKDSDSKSEASAGKTPQKPKVLTDLPDSLMKLDDSIAKVKQIGSELIKYVPGTLYPPE